MKLSKNSETADSPEAVKRRFKLSPAKAVVIFLAVIFCIYLAIGLYSGLCIRYYTVDSEKINANIRIVLVTDLHSCKYGEGQSELISAVKEQDPDIIVLAGDIFDDLRPNDNTKIFLQGISCVCPCFYVTGNHEFRVDENTFEENMYTLESLGVTVLSGEAIQAEINGVSLNICGVDDPEGAKGFAYQLESVAKQADPKLFTLLLSHRPERFDSYVGYGFDLALCGHAHGGQWRVPFLINGVYAPDQGLFPKYAGGLYQSGGTTMIVSRGLARENVPIPRIYDRPEVVVIDIV